MCEQCFPRLACHPSFSLRSGMNCSYCFLERPVLFKSDSQHSIQIECCADQREMCKGLREITLTEQREESSSRVLPLGRSVWLCRRRLAK